MKRVGIATLAAALSCLAFNGCSSKADKDDDSPLPSEGGAGSASGGNVGGAPEGGNEGMSGGETSEAGVGPGGAAAGQGGSGDSGAAGSDGGALDPVPHEVVWSDDFEGGFGEWSVEGGLWAIGKPDYAEGPTALSGMNLAGTNLTGDYLTDQDARLVTPEFTVPDAALLPRFKYALWHDFGNGDHGQVEVSVDGGEWDVLDPLVLEGQTGGWSQQVIKLQDYAHQSVRIGLRLIADHYNGNGPGWYIDDVSLETGEMTFESPEGFEQGMGDWSAEGGLWAFGAPTYEDGPTPLTGSKLAGTNLVGPYLADQVARLVSPEVLVQPTHESPRFKFTAWYDFGSGDTGKVQVSLDGGAWADVDDKALSGTSGGWGQTVIPLDDYVGKRVRFGLLLTGDHYNGTGPGWYIDQASFEID